MDVVKRNRDNHEITKRFINIQVKLLYSFKCTCCSTLVLKVKSILVTILETDSWYQRRININEFIQYLIDL